MSRNSTSIVIILVVLTVLPQLLLMWTARAAESLTAVCIGTAVITVGLALTALVSYYKSNVRRSVSVFAVSGCGYIVTLLASLLLLVCGATVRTSIYAYLVIALVMVVVLVPFVGFALSATETGVFPADKGDMK